MKELICIVCPRGCHLKVDENDDYKVTGHRCARGVLYGYQEMTAPTRVVTSTVVLENAVEERCPVRTSQAVPKAKMFEVIDIVRKLKISAPVSLGQVIVPDIAGSGADLIATRSFSGTGN